VTTRVRIFDGALDRLIDDEVGSLVDRCMGAGVESAQRLVPIDTGALRNSIAIVDEAHRDGDDVVGTYGAGGGDVDYQLHVEFGTSVGPEQPYLRPSIDAVLQEARR
jgi:hypothetical protein